jgi:hypothetical protein
VVEKWDNIRMDVKAMNRRTEALLQQADPLHVDGGQLTLVAAYPFHQKRLNDDDTRRIIEDVIERQIGKKLTVLCVSRDEAQSLRSQAPAAAPPRRSSPPAQPPQEPASSDREGSTSAGSSTARDEDDADHDPPPPMPDYDPEYDLDDDILATPSAVSSLDIDEERIKAAINIFDAVIVDDED